MRSASRKMDKMDSASAKAMNSLLWRPTLRRNIWNCCRGAGGLTLDFLAVCNVMWSINVRIPDDHKVTEKRGPGGGCAFAEIEVVAAGNLVMRNDLGVSAGVISDHRELLGTLDGLQWLLCRTSDEVL